MDQNLSQNKNMGPRQGILKLNPSKVLNYALNMWSEIELNLSPENSHNKNSKINKKIKQTQ